MTASWPSIILVIWPLRIIIKRQITTTAHAGRSHFVFYLGPHIILVILVAVYHGATNFPLGAYRMATYLHQRRHRHAFSWLRSHSHSFFVTLVHTRHDMWLAFFASIHHSAASRHLFPSPRLDLFSCAGMNSSTSWSSSQHLITFFTGACACRRQRHVVQKIIQKHIILSLQHHT
jgi:hypothetical protein